MEYSAEEIDKLFDQWKNTPVKMIADSISISNREIYYDILEPMRVAFVEGFKAGLQKRNIISAEEQLQK